MYTHNTSNNQQVKKTALKYLENTYHEKFLIEEYAEKSLLTPSHHFRVKSFKHRRLFNLYLNPDNKFEDDYFCLQLEQEANGYFKEIIKLENVDIQTRVVIYNNKRPKGLMVNASFRDFINTGEALIFLYIISNRSLILTEKAEILSKIETTSAVQLGSFIEITNIELIKKINDPVIIMSQLSLIKNKLDFKLNSQQKLVLEEGN
ncbi:MULTISPECIES: hypothetical protein [unclassified Enterococcus]|uniref:hypothetical protein n=1 Tax=unclassified Enterococcus TaxID=2608891 RepID=UPI0015533CA5|nr:MULTISPECIES: hypothetical protein [unclassified Enterococcus]MBS7576547.1 hypothetical protein [Enterococcus sp. MMGLQ5-2]MBS7583966.1 hypothetical protein [Enterococcus sp. MMGLQ5-1]NPD11827.1 hypothetical protein [Enterococcus sp. MMGLQ5-1]NPD36384.1 hypothetical protein [Enterococcus sp. MMGLQ5-2]